METKKFLEQFVVTGDMVETDMEEIYCRALEENDALKMLVERAFKLGVAEGLASAEYAIVCALKIKVDDMDTSRNPALRTVMKMSERCYRAIREQPEEPQFVAHESRAGAKFDRRGLHPILWKAEGGMEGRFIHKEYKGHKGNGNGSTPKHTNHAKGV